MQEKIPPPSSTKTGTDSIVAEEKKFSDKLQDAWNVVEKSRHVQRPHALDYIHRLFADFEEIKGDRCFGEDLALVGGVGALKNPLGKEEKKVFFLAHQKGRNTKQKIERNFGMAKPEGYRKAIRIMEMAVRFKKPLITLIDTPGAFPGVGAEERGQSEAIASSILKMFQISTPIVGVVIGEGGSGGALAIGVADKLLMLENSIYSVISPESCAAILWGNSGESKRAALALKLGAQDTFDLGLCDEIIKEPEEGAHQSFEKVSQALSERINSHLDDLLKQSPELLVKSRYEKFRNIDARHFS